MALWSGTPIVAAALRRTARPEAITRISRRSRAVAPALLAAWLAACSSSGPATQVTALPPIAFTADDVLDAEHRMAVGDVLAVSFPFRPGLDQDVVVRTDGLVSFPLVGALRAAGRTPEEVQAVAREAYLALGTGGEPETKAYRIGAGDVLEVRFERVPELNVTVPVRPDGRISLERARELLAEGRTPQELEQSLRAAYHGYLLHPDVAVIVREFAADRAYVGDRAVGGFASQLAGVNVAVRSTVPRQVFVAGEVRTPGFLEYRAPMTLMQAVVGAGGTPRSARVDQVLILRKVGTDEPTATLVDLSRELDGRGTSDVPLRPYDIVIVPKTRIAKVTDFLDQYVYQLVPATRNVNFTYFFDLQR